MRAPSDTRPLEELPRELGARVRAAAGSAAEIDEVPEAAGYRISAMSGDRVMEMYVELRPDGCVEERTQVRQQFPSIATKKTAKGRPNVGNTEKLSDEELLDRLRTALADVVMFGQADPADLREAWQRVVEGIRDLERRYPPESEESA